MGLVPWRSIKGLFPEGEWMVGIKTKTDVYSSPLFHCPISAFLSRVMPRLKLGVAVNADSVET